MVEFVTQRKEVEFQKFHLQFEVIPGGALPLKQRRTTGKWILREAMRPYLPPEVITRPKSGFGAPIRSWINGPLSRQVEEILNDDSLRRRRVFAPAGVQRLLKSVKEGSTDGAYSILAIICLESWFRQFLD